MYCVENDDFENRTKNCSSIFIMYAMYHINTLQIIIHKISSSHVKEKNHMRSHGGWKKIESIVFFFNKKKLYCSQSGPLTQFVDEHWCMMRRELYIYIYHVL